MVQLFRSFGLSISAITLLLTGSLFVSGCSDDPFAPYEPEIDNNTDSFSLQATGVEGVTTTKDYVWSNTGTSANVNQATTVSKGSVTLKVLDGEGQQVYLANLSSNGTSQTSTGVSGDWTIRLVLTDYSGTINFSLEKP